jgi:DNA adenine methylase
MSYIDKKPNILNPFIKWPGGKTQEIKIILDNLPDNYDRYFEPFLGGGSVFFAIGAENAVINDISFELISLYRFISDRNIDFFDKLYEINKTWDLLSELVLISRSELLNMYNSFKFDLKTLDNVKHKTKYQNLIFDFVLKNDTILNGLMKQHFNINIENFLKEIKKSLYQKMSRMSKLESKLGTMSTNDIFDNIETAFKSAYYTHFRYLYNHKDKYDISQSFASSIFYFIREYCYSSMFRYNRNGHFNVPYGGLSYNKKNLLKKIEYMNSDKVSEYLQKSSIECLDFSALFDIYSLSNTDFIFLDPPYDSDFSTYAKNEFDKSDQKRLADFLINTPAKFMLVIKNTDYIRGLYENHPHISIFPFDKTYSVSFKARNEREVEHLLIKNY